MLNFVLHHPQLGYAFEVGLGIIGQLPGMGGGHCG